jgi:hypothetical protein
LLWLSRGIWRRSVRLQRGLVISDVPPSASIRSVSPTSPDSGQDRGMEPTRDVLQSGKHAGQPPLGPRQLARHQRTPLPLRPVTPRDQDRAACGWATSP